MLKYITSAGIKRELSGVHSIIRDVLAAGAGLYLLFAAIFYPEPILHRSIAFGLFYMVIFMSYTTPGSGEMKKIPVYDWILSAMSLGVSIYVGLNIQRIITRRNFFDEVFTLDIVFAVITLILLIEGTRRVIGPWLPALSLLALAYFAFGHNIPGRFGHIKQTVESMTDGLFLTHYGIWGSTMGIATGKIMIFILFGTLFRYTGAGDFLFDFVSKIAGSMKGGIAKISIVSSALFGMVSGGPLTNATTTGAMTIPAMKRSGYSNEYSACVESCASVGGVFMPPIMGAVAFLMSEVVGIQYGEVITRAFIPAVIYFAALFFSVDMYARKNKIAGHFKKSNESLLKLIARGYNFFIPLGYLIFRLVSGRVVAKAGLETIALMLILALFNKKKRLSFKMIYDSLKAAVNMGVMIVATMATCGILVGIIDITGLAGKFSSYLTALSDVSVIITLVMVMLVTLFMGLAMNISSSYVIMAVLGAPVLISLGYEALSVHMFILFFAAMATITPPVAITSYAAATIAGAPPMKVGFMSMKVGMVAYILPFAFIFNPALLLYGSLMEIISAAVWALLGTGIMAMGLEGWFFDKKAGALIRACLIISGVLIVMGQLTTIIIATAIMAMVFISKLNFIKKTREVSDEEN